MNHTIIGMLGLGLGLAIGIAMQPTAAQQQEFLNVRFVDLRNLRENYKDYQLALEDVKEIKDQEQEELDKLSAEFDRSVQNYKLKEDLWPSEDEKRVEYEKLKNKWQDLEGYFQTRNEELERKSRDKMKPFIDRMKGAIEEVAVANKVHLVFYETNLAFSDSRLDLTPEILVVLNQE